MPVWASDELDQVSEIPLSHRPSRHAWVELFAAMIHAFGDGTAQRFVIIRIVVSMPIIAGMVIVCLEQGSGDQRWDLDPETRHKPSTEAVGPVTARAAAYMHAHMHTAACWRDWQTRGGCSSEIDSLAIAAKLGWPVIAVHVRTKSEIEAATCERRDPNDENGSQDHKGPDAPLSEFRHRVFHILSSDFPGQHPERLNADNQRSHIGRYTDLYQALEGWPSRSCGGAG